MDEVEKLNERISKLEKNFRKFVDEVNKMNRKFLIGTKSDLFLAIAREIKNECNQSLFMEFMYDKGIISQKEFLEYRKKSKLFKAYKDENEQATKIYNYHLTLEQTQDTDEELTNYYNKANHLVIREQFLAKKEGLIKREFTPDSPEVKELEELIKELDEKIYKKDDSLDKRKIKPQEYFLKKEEAEQIFENLINRKEEIVERIREVPLLGDRVHLEANNKSLYYEVVSNY